MFINSDNVYDFKGNHKNKIGNLKYTILTVRVCLRENKLDVIEDKVTEIFFSYEIEENTILSLLCFKTDENEFYATLKFFCIYRKSITKRMYSVIDDFKFLLVFNNEFLPEFPDFESYHKWLNKAIVDLSSSKVKSLTIF